MYLPYSLNIGLTNRCNLKCYFCPVSRTKIKREDMSMDMAFKIIRDVKVEHHISLALFGESTLYEHLSEVVDAVRRKGVQSILYTNGQILTKGMLNVNKLVISLDATSREEYIETKGIDGYDRVLGHIKELMSHKKRPEITVQFADLKYKNEFPKVKADKIKHGRYISWGDQVEWKSDSKRKIRKPLPCLHIYRFLNVASNGDVVMCCLDYNHSTVLGNVREGNIMDIWNGSKFNKLRKLQEEGKFSDLCLKCENEAYYHPSK